MKKFSIVLIAIIFIACLVLGFMVMSQVYGPGASPFTLQSASTESANLISLEQKNYLIVQVDDLSASAPQLVSVWLAFLYTGTPPHLMLLPLFPSDNTGRATALQQDFALTSTREVPPSFIKSIQSQYDVELIGYLLVDNSSIQTLGQWITGENLPFYDKVGNNGSIADSLQPSKDFLAQVCRSIRSNGLDSADQIRWSQIIPDHFNTGITFPELMSTWDAIGSTNRLRCEIVIP